MPARAAMPHTAPLTRRQIREAERRAEQAAIRQAAARAAASLSGSHLATIPLDGTLAPVTDRPALPAPAPAEPAAVDPTPATADAPTEAVARTARETEDAEPVARIPLDGTLAPARTADGRPFRSRAELRAAERAAARRHLHAPRWVPRAAVVCVLGAATIVAPLTGFAGTGEPQDEQRTAVAAVPSGQTLLDDLDAAAGRFDSESAGSAAALLADTGATARALVQSSRSVDRDAAVCTVAAGSGANGAGAALRGEPGLVMPLVAGSYTQSSLYGNRVHPINGRWSMHTGLDFAAPLGTDIHAVADGVVVHAGEGIDGRSSMLVIIEHELDGQTFYSWYVHMYPDGVFVSEGQQVRAGEVIGEVGNNGNSTGPHLHLAIHLDTEGTTTDPGAFLADHDAAVLAADC